jgi:hypothetical protein
MLMAPSRKVLLKKDSPCGDDAFQVSSKGALLKNLNNNVKRIMAGNSHPEGV